MTYQNLLHEVSKQIASWGDTLEGPISRKELNKLNSDILVNYCIPLPDDFIEFLNITNGLEFNGLIIFGSKNITVADPFKSELLEANITFHEVESYDLRKLLLIGETSSSVLTYDHNSNSYQLRDRIALDRLEEFSTFKELLAGELEKVISNT